MNDALNNQIRLAILTCLVLLSSNSWAQHGADPNAVDLRDKMQVIDTSGEFDLLPNLRMPDFDGDGYDDLLMGRYSDTRSNYSQLHRGGSFLFGQDESSWILHEPEGTGKLSGTSFADVITDYVHNRFSKNHGIVPYFDTIPHAQFWFQSYLPYIMLLGIVDYDGDGILDVVCVASDFLNEKLPINLLVYKGPLTQETGYLLPTDSLPFAVQDGSYEMIVGKVSSGRLPVICIAQTDTTLGHQRTRIGLVRNRVRLSQDTIAWISNSDSDGVNVRKMYAMDITGDGVDDLLVSDGDSIFIYNGNAKFGDYPLTRHNAYYIIPAPGPLQPYYSFIQGFGGYMHSCGDLTGSGIPVLMTTGQQHDEFGNYVTYAFFYSGGKALDSLYDAIYFENRPLILSLDTLHSINTDGRTAAVLQHSETNFLIYQGADKIPHKPNPNLRSVSTRLHMPSSVSIYPSIARKFVKVDVMANEQQTTIDIRNILGETVASRNCGRVTSDQTEEFDLSNLPAGAYYVVVHGGQDELHGKFFIQH